AGFLVDRYDARRLMFLAATAQAGVAVALAFSSGVPAVIGLTALLGTGAALAQPAEFALVPALGGANLGRANSFVETARALGFAAGPFAGGLLSAAGGMKLGLRVAPLHARVRAGRGVLREGHARRRRRGLRRAARGLDGRHGARRPAART